MINNTFTTTLAALRRGNTLSDLSVELANLVGRIRETGKKGSLTLKLTLIPADTDAEAITIDDDISVKVPKLTKSKTTFFTDEQNGLQRDNPRQPDFPSMIEGGRSEDRNAAAASNA